MQDIIASIDVGTTKICTLIAEVEGEGKLRLIGSGVSPSRGMSKGVVTNIEEVVQAISESVNQAQHACGYQINSAYVGVTGNHVSSTNSRASLIVGRTDRPINQDDIEHILNEAHNIAVPHNRQVLHAIPRQYTVDGQDSILDPIGMLGYKLEVEAHIITALTTAIRNLYNCIQACGIEPTQLILQPLASAEAVLRPEEKKMGVVLVDIGGGTTDIAIYIEGAVWHTFVLGVGGNHLANDIAVGLRAPFATAEELKVRYGHAIPDAVDPHEYVDINTFGDGPRQSVSRRDLATIISYRSEEIFELILREIKRSGYDGLLPAGVVLTGGGAELPGFAELAMSKLQMPARIGAPTGLEGLISQINTPSYATAVGLLLWGLRNGNTARHGFESEKAGVSGLLNRFFDLVKVFLPR